MSVLRSLYRHTVYGIQLVVLLALLAGCTGGFMPPSTVNPQSTGAAGGTPLAEVTFEAHLPRQLLEGQNLYLEFLDEVTGLALNATRTQMQPVDSKTYQAKLPFALGSVLKYRYVRDNDPVGVEYTTQNQQVRYRLYVVDSPGLVNDTISAWRSVPSEANLGRVQGQVANRSGNAPVVNALVTAGGMSTLTASDGSFVIEGLPPGNHNMVVYSLDGLFRPFQQGAVVAPDSTTPALVMVDNNQTVEVTFIVKPPADHLQGVPVRFIGNLYSLGNTFADLSGGANVLSSRSPIMSMMPDGRYSLRLTLPVGLDLRYKYTLGDGFWNAERTAAGDTLLRQLIVPNRPTTIEDGIATWRTPGLGPITFSVQAPAATPLTDTLSIQFNPFGWTEPIPMWPLGNNQWMYVLYSPLNLFESASYRYCRNEQCGSADSVDTHGSAAGKPFSPKASAQEIKDTISGWVWMEPATDPVIVSSDAVNKREAGFLAGVEFSAAYKPSWQPYILWGFQHVRSFGSNTVMLAPTWHLTHQNPPVIAPFAGRDALWSDVTQLAVQAQQSGLGLVLHPTLAYDQEPSAWWNSAALDAGWWDTWFANYRTFILYHADMAAQTGARALVIGDGSIIPALPGGVLAEGTAGASSNLPADAEDRWRSLLADVRARYNGRVVWFIDYAGALPPIPNITDSVDALYVQLSPPLANADVAALVDLETSIGEKLDGDILGLQEQTNLPVYLGLRYPSARGALDGCVDSAAACLTAGAFTGPSPEYPDVAISYKEQADAYSALLSLVNRRSWINAFFAVGYYPPVELRDMSVSVRGKPAVDVLGYWYPRLLGGVTQ